MRATKFLLIIGFLITVLLAFKDFNEPILFHIVDLKKQNLKFYLKNDEGENFKNFKNLQTWLNKKKNENLVFAMNGGMYKKDGSPQGLYIENGVTITLLDTLSEGYGNFYLQPNGVFYITESNEGNVCRTEEFSDEGVKYATQSGPLLLVNGEINSEFTKGSKNLNIRNGVGILPGGEILLAMSKDKINFYDFADYFKSRGCKNALYLDGFVSKTYLPEKKWVSSLNDGYFGVIIGETKKEQ